MDVEVSVSHIRPVLYLHRGGAVIVTLASFDRCHHAIRCPGKVCSTKGCDHHSHDIVYHHSSLRRQRSVGSASTPRPRRAIAVTNTAIPLHQEMPHHQQVLTVAALMAFRMRASLMLLNLTRVVLSRMLGALVTIRVSSAATVGSEIAPSKAWPSRIHAAVKPRYRQLTPRPAFRVITLFAPSVGKLALVSFLTIRTYHQAVR